MGLPRILLADDHHEMLEKVAHLLSGEFEVLATVRNGRLLVEAATDMDPDLIVTDISMPVLNGIAAACLLKDSASRAKVIFLTVHDDPAFVRAAVSAGACGYVLKNRIFSDLIPAIREVLQGHVFASEPVSLQ